MATVAQILANQANAQLSTGPATEAGKARSSRNNLRHGLTLGVLAVEPAEQQEHKAFQEELAAECQPDGIMELEAFQQFVDAAWRLQKIRRLVAALFDEFGDDPFVHPEGQARLKTLLRYRASAEMIVYRAAKVLRELQTTALYRAHNLTAEEDAAVPAFTRPARRWMVGDRKLGTLERMDFYELHGANHATARWQIPVKNDTPPAQAA